MLQPDAAHPIGHGDEEVIVVVLARAEQAVGLDDQGAQDADLFVRRGDVFPGVGDDVEEDGRTAARVQIDLAIVFTGEHRAVDEDVERDGLEGDGAAARAGGTQGGAVFPAFGQGHAGLDSDVPVEAAGGVEQHLLPLDVQHLGRHRDAALGPGCRRQVLELGHQFGGAGRNDDVEGVGAERIPHPFDPLAAGGEGQAGELGHRADRAVVAGQPFREEQGHRAGGLDRNGLAHAIDAAVQVRGVDVEADDAGPGAIDDGGDGLGRWGSLGECRGGGGEQEGRETGGEDETLHDAGNPTSEQVAYQRRVRQIVKRECFPLPTGEGPGCPTSLPAVRP